MSARRGERLTVIAVLAGFTVLVIMLTNAMETAEAQRDDLQRRYTDVTNAPTPTVTVQTPGPTVTATVRVTQRASRDFTRKPAAVEKQARKSSGLDLRHAALWDRIAACESGGRWSYNGPSGYDGGLQFLPSTWVSMGGRDFAPYAWQATRAEQITVANRASRSGTNPYLKPWPVCGKRAAAALGYAFP